MFPLSPFQKRCFALRHIRVFTNIIFGLGKQEEFGTVAKREFLQGSGGPCVRVKPLGADVFARDESVRVEEDLERCHVFLVGRITMTLVRGGPFWLAV